MSRHHGKAWSGTYAAEARRYWANILKAMGSLPCSRCGHPVYEGEAWDVDHVVPLSTPGASRGRENQQIAHRSCNRRAGQALGQQTQRRNRDAARGIRPW